MPVPPRSGPPGPGALAALPIVGAALGAGAGFAAAGAARIFPAPLPAAVAWCALAALSGALHLDGFLDGCDAFSASVAPARRLEILEDPHHGSFAVAGLFGVGALAFGALSAMPARAYPTTLAYAAALSRAAAITGAFVFPGARQRSGASHYAREPGALLAVASALGILLVARPVRPRAGALLVPLALVSALALEAWICGRVGGLVGDAYGFTIVLVETELFVVLAARRWYR